MSTDNQPQAEPEIGPPITDTPAAPETPAEKAKRARTTHPIRILLVGSGGSLQIVPGSPEFTEQRAADAWILANGERDGQAYRTGRLGPVVKLAVQLVEVEP